MNFEHKLELLSDAARFDLCNSLRQPGRRYTPKQAQWPNHTLTDDGNTRPQSVFRVLMSSSCAWNCSYCPLRAANDPPRATLEPEELVQAFLPRYQTGTAQGLFLSTAVLNNVNNAVGRMLDGIELLRARHQYDGYIHVKLLPGTQPNDVERAVHLANRVSLNLEAPSAMHLARISPERNWQTDVLERLRWARDWQRTVPLFSAGLATQFVVGSAGEDDRDLLNTGMWLYNEFDMRRIYFGAFRPVAGTPLESTVATPLVRVQRLQQADWLLRQYGFRSSELPFDTTGHLPLHLDPKLAWALAHPEYFPVELNTATPEVLLRVPGIGPVSIRRIQRLRQSYPFRELQHLLSLSSQAGRARDFVTLDGHFFGRDADTLQRDYAQRVSVSVEQLTLW